jgi:TonB family protein
MLIVSIKETEPAAERSPKRPSFLVSALVHVIMITLLIRTATAPEIVAMPPPASASTPPPKNRAVFLPPAAVLRQLVPPPPRPAAPQPEPRPNVPPRLVAPEPSSTPKPTPPPEARDGVRVGPRDGERTRQPLVLRPDTDLASGTTPSESRPGSQATPTPEPEKLGREERAGIGGPGTEPSPQAPDRGRLARTGREDDAPLGPDGTRRARGGVKPATPPPPGGQRPIAESLRRLEQQMGQAGTAGTTGAVGRQMGPLFFDPEGADFTAWINHFKNEVYRNWVVPQSALMGAVRGHVDFEFSVLRDGTLAEVRLLKSSGTPALDRAAGNALIGSRYLSLPSDYRPARVSMQVSFFYGEGPRG